MSKLILAAGAVFALVGPAIAAPQQSPSPPADICLTNACSERPDVAVKTAVPTSVLERAQNEARSAMEFMQAGLLGKEMSKMPAGQRVELKTSLRTETGEVLPLTIVANANQSNFNSTDPNKTATQYMIGAVVDATGDAIRVNAAYRLNGESMIIPPQSLTPGQTVVANLPNGRQISMTATVRAETPQETSQAALMDARMKAALASRPPGP